MTETEIIKLYTDAGYILRHKDIRAHFEQPKHKPDNADLFFGGGFWCQEHKTHEIIIDLPID